MAWNKAITTAGYALIAQAMLGTRIEFTRMVIGDGIRSTGFSSATGAVHELYSLPLAGVLRSGTKVTVTSAIAPDDLEEGYELREIVVFAKPEGGAEICFSAACNAEGAIHVEPNSSSVSMDGRIRWAYEISPEGNVTIETGGLLYADYDHRHDNATQSADGHMSAGDKEKMDNWLGQDVSEDSTPIFAAATIGGVYIDSSGVAHGIQYEA